MSVTRGFFITLISGISFAICGALLGYLLGVQAPHYYRTVFRIPPDMPMNVAQVGMGLGLTQGLAAGLVVGLVIVVTVAWYDVRIQERAKQSSNAK